MAARKARRLFGLLFLQLWLAWIGFAVPFPVGFLHPINAFLILALVSWIVHSEWLLWRERKAPAASRRRPRPHSYSGRLWWAEPTRNGVNTPA